MALQWQSKLASIERCRCIVKCYGAWLTFFPYLGSKEQVCLQGLDHWTYGTGVPRAIRIVPIWSAVYLLQREDIVMLEKNDKVTVLKSDIDSSIWGSIQIRRHIFQIKHSSRSTRMLENSGSSQFQVIMKAPMNRERHIASICNMENKFIFATGGGISDGRAQSSVERYEIARDVWEEMPQMNVARIGHGSCTLGNVVFAICGHDSGVEFNSIEKLVTCDLQAGWQLIQMPPASLLTPRTRPVVEALNSSKILIMGGYKGELYYQDALTFETETNFVKIVI